MPEKCLIFPGDASPIPGSLAVAAEICPLLMRENAEEAPKRPFHKILG
jgi:hypothetical protein